MVYLDNSATTRVRPEVLEEIIDVNLNCYGNPSSLHRMGLMAEKKVEEARKSVAKLLNATPQEIYFTGSGTESNNIAIFGILSDLREKNNIITTKIEHPSVYNVFKELEKKCQVKYLDTDNKGKINLAQLEEMIDENTKLVSLAHVNNEIGVIQDLDNIARVIKSKTETLNSTLTGYNLMVN